jgi:hypothetical protein
LLRARLIYTTLVITWLSWTAFHFMRFCSRN